MLRRSFALLLAALALPGCDGLDRIGLDRLGLSSRPVIGAPVPMQAQATAKQLAGSGGTRVVLLAPLTGERASIGQALVQAARIALDTERAPPFDPQDTAGTAEGAASAAHAAIAAGAGIILGPLSAAETAAVAPIARAAGVPVLAFTNDATQAQPGVWALGITPGQQAQRLAAALQAQGKGRLAGLLPENDFGRALGTGLTQAAVSLGLPEPHIRTYAPDAPIGTLNMLVRDMANYAARRGPIEAEARVARASGTAMGRRRASEINRRAVPPAPFDGLLLADSGENLESFASLLAYYDANQPHVRVLGPSIWAAAESGASKLMGAWYAAPDPSNRVVFARAYTARTGAAPPAIADIAFDAAAMAWVTASTGFNLNALTRADGYLGANGLLALQMDGRVRRGLAVFEIQRGGPKMIEPAPQTLSASGS